MGLLLRLARWFVDRVVGWGRAPDREALLDARSAGPCPLCGRERIRLRDVRVDDLGYSVRLRERLSCGCDDDPTEPAWRADPAGAA